MNPTIPPPAKYHLITYGCQMNVADSERLAGSLESIGLSATADPRDADVIVVNTCMVRRKPEEKAIRRMAEFAALKRAGNRPVVVAAGCVSQKLRDELFARAPAIDVVIGPLAIPQLPGLLERAFAGERRLSGDLDDTGGDLKAVPVKRTARHGALVTVMTGCDNFCSYCVVPFARGRERSHDATTVLAEIGALLADGCREITLLGQNVNSYRSAGLDFAGLLDEIERAFPGDWRLRFVTSHPKDLSDRLIDRFATSRLLAPGLHLPVQSGDDGVLARMNRGYTRAHYLALVAKLRAARPEIALTTDLIAGFPGESDEAFAATESLLEAVRFDAAFTFHYTERPGTKAATLPDPLPPEVRMARLDRLIAIQNRITRERNAEQIGRTVRALVEGRSRRSEAEWQGRADDNRVVNFPDAPGVAEGAFVRLRVTGATAFALRGELSPDPMPAPAADLTEP